MHRAFTLIELLVVVAIISILAIVVVLVINPAELLRQARDAGRVSDMATLTTALNLYVTQGGTSLGSSNILYLSTPDPAATSTSGDQCQGLGLPTAPSGYTYACPASSTYRNASGNGWIPINFQQNAFGSPLANLPIDPVNQTSSDLYYTYSTNGSQFEVTALPESQKYKTQYGQTPAVPGYPDVIANGSNLTIDPSLSSTGLVGYWPLNEGSGSSTIDQSGNGNTGTWVGNGPYYTTNAKVGTYAGNFDGSTDYVFIPNTGNKIMPTSNQPFTISVWLNTNTVASAWYAIGSNETWLTSGYRFVLVCNGTSCIAALWCNQSGGTLTGINTSALSANTWYLVTVSYNGTSGSTYLNGVLQGTTTGTVLGNTNNIDWGGGIGGVDAFSGYLDDARIYNRALSASEVQGLYYAQK